MKKLLYVLTGLCLLAGVFTGCEAPLKDSDAPNGGGATSGDDTIPVPPIPTVQGSIKGVVTDKETGEPLSGVMVMLQPYSKRVQTAEDGMYRFDSLKIRAYILSAQKDGYEDYMYEGVTPIADQTLQLDIEMKEAAPIIDTDYIETAFGISLEMVYVEGGTFEMGATSEQGSSNSMYGDTYARERPVHRVTLNGFHIGRYEVTQEQWYAVMGTSPSSFNYTNNLPVEQVSWNDAQEFCKKLSEATGKKYVLPTEAQWEYAARGGNKSRHYRYAGANNNDFQEAMWCRIGNQTFNLYTHPVGTKMANELGLYDMSGNVDEWCSDWFGSYSSSSAVNPQGPSRGEYRVVRGGSYLSEAFPYCRVASRFADSPDRPVNDRGFRVACSAK